jgi:hypothetical protein
MSHFTVTICLDGSNDTLARARRVAADGFPVIPAAVEECVTQVLAPFDENREVEPYRDYLNGGPANYWAVKLFREEDGLNPDDATLTWAQVAEVHNKRWDDEPPLLIAEDGRAYTTSTRNPDAKWDWWSVGGRWTGYFPYRPEFAREVIHGQPGLGADKVAPLHCDGGPKRALNLDALRAEKVIEATACYAEFHALIAGTPEAKSWASFRADLDAKRLTIEEARRQYHEQPAVRALEGTDFRWHDDPIAEFGVPESLYVGRQEARAVPGYATITTDGRWMAPGLMGWFGMSDHTEDSQIGYWEAANAYIDSLSDDAFLVVVDCHI